MYTTSGSPVRARAAQSVPSFGTLVAGHQDRAVAERAMRERDAERGRRGEPRGDAVDDLEPDARGVERRAFLAAAPEHHGVAALQAHDDPSGARLGHHQALDEVLRRRLASAPLADANHARVGPGVGEHLFRDEIVGEHDVGALQRPHRLQRQQLRVAGTGAHEVDEAAHRDETELQGERAAVPIARQCAADERHLARERERHGGPSLEHVARPLRGGGRFACGQLQPLLAVADQVRDRLAVDRDLLDRLRRVQAAPPARPRRRASGRRSPARA
jgi:hypothetical protein